MFRTPFRLFTMKNNVRRFSCNSDYQVIREVSVYTSGFFISFFGFSYIDVKRGLASPYCTYKRISGVYHIDLDVISNHIKWHENLMLSIFFPITVPLSTIPYILHAIIS
jgi:hypothetical protein